MAGPIPGPGAAAPGQAVRKEPNPKIDAKADPKAAKVAKEPKAKKERDPNAPARPRLPKFPDEHVITVMKPESKARGAADRFKRYTTGMSVKQYVDKISEEFNRTSGQTQADMRWDMDHGFIHVGPQVVPVPAQQEPAQSASNTAAA